MTTRQIKDAKDKSTNKLIYFKGHAQATYMSDGRTVEDAIKQAEENGGGHQEISEDVILDMGFTKNTGTYSKPSGGIPKSDLSNDVQTSLDKADTALQSYTEQYTGTYSKPSGGIPKSDLSNGVRTSLDKADNAITGISINGATQQPSSGVVDLGYINKQLMTTTSSSMTLSPNIYYRNTSTSLSTLSISLGSVSNNNILNEYFVEFTTRELGTTISLPSTVKWVNGEYPVFESGATYQISIINNLGVVTKFK